MAHAGYICVALISLKVKLPTCLAIIPLTNVILESSGWIFGDRPSDPFAQVASILGIFCDVTGSFTEVQMPFVVRHVVPLGLAFCAASLGTHAAIYAGMRVGMLAGGNVWETIKALYFLASEGVVRFLSTVDTCVIFKEQMKEPVEQQEQSQV
eukprot:Phypoly_transcript_20687.p1 GENE.Phypoly_transcript_20687~~Phypoly_transcript_20687.p1  ORF type:complete len:153 (+),score=21.99 Phypoly_transcript_20687:117-575(+)